MHPISNIVHSTGEMNFWGYNSLYVDTLFEEESSIYETAKVKVLYA